MSSSLSTLQIAALQEMGITVWSKQPDTTEDNNAGKHNELNVSQASSAANVQHLRSLVSSQERANVVEKPFPADATRRFEQWIVDVEQAMSGIPTADSKIAWVLGDGIKVTTSSVCLPALPSELSTPLKKQLWQQIQQLHRER